jgi:hypothetical protein
MHVGDEKPPALVELGCDDRAGLAGSAITFVGPVLLPETAEVAISASGPWELV